jgi:membrane associated rhomboid family serine protease
MFPLRDSVESKTVPIVTWIIMGLNGLVFLFELSLGTSGLESFMSKYGVVPAALTSQPDVAEYGTIFSSMFLHAGWAHLIGNMWFLFIFGDNVEDRFGHFFYLVVYLIAGVCAAMTQTLIDPHSEIAMVGASGAISGVLGAYLVFYPSAKVEALLPLGYISRVVNVPAVVFLLLWFGVQLLPGIASLGSLGKEAGGVAFWAHVGGFLTGVFIAIVARAFRKRDDVW